MDGIGSSSHQKMTKVQAQIHGNISVLAITAKPSLLDPALRRRGRLDSEIEIMMPDDKMRKKIIQSQINEHLNGRVPGLTEEKLLALARKAKGFSGADTLLAIKEAMRLSILSNFREDDFIVELDVLERAISRTNPSSIRDVVVEVPAVKWEDIGGMENVKTLLR